MSYILSTTTLPRSSSNAEFQGWGKQISDAIANCGIIKQSDANVGTQIDWATVAAPSATNQSRGYEIYAFDDAMQATTPVYFKIEYGSGSASATPSLWLTTGNGANASGNITGNTSSRGQFTGTSGAANVTSYYSGANNRFCMLFASGGAVVSHIHVGMERTLNSNGNVTADGLAIIGGYSTSWRQVLWMPVTGNVTPWEQTASAIMPGTVAGSGAPMAMPGGEHLAVYPLFFNKGAVWFPPQTMFLLMFNGNFTNGTKQEIPIYGANVDYIVNYNGNTSFYVTACRGGNKVTAMMRWD